MPRRPGAPAGVRPPNLPAVHLSRDYPPGFPAAQVRQSIWLRVRPGAYVETLRTDDDPHRADRALALARLAAVGHQLRAGYVVSHGSAALLWGLPLLTTPAFTHVISAQNPSNDPSDVVRHVHELRWSDRTVLQGRHVTSLERTVVDCATTLGAWAGLVVADAAFHAGASRKRCLEILGGMAGRRGVVTARAVLELADDGAESPGESSARFVLLRAGLPVPQTQVRVQTHAGIFWSDLGWPEWHLLAEYDGRAKYEANGPASAAVLAEKRRQDAIEEAGNRVLRITKEDVRDPDRLVTRTLRTAPRGTLRHLRPRPALMAPPPRSRF